MNLYKVFVTTLLATVFLVLGEVNSFNLCSQFKLDLCVGISGDPLPGTPLQFKSRFNNMLSGSNRTSWEVEDDKFLKLVWTVPAVNNSTNSTVSVLYMDKFSGGTRAILSKKSEGAFLNGSSVILNGTSLCLTVMKCSPTNGFCDPFSSISVRDVDDLRRSSFMRFKPCETNHVGQMFEVDPPCARNCTEAELNNTSCDLACNIKECFFDHGHCNTTTPTLMPTLTPTTTTPSQAPTHPTPLVTSSPSVYSLSPTTTPTSLRSPTISPSRVTTHPTSVPTSSDTNSPSFSPTQGISQTFSPSNSPSSIATVLPPSTTQVPPPTMSPILPSLAETTFSPTSPDILGFQWGYSLALVLISVLLLILIFMNKKRVKEVEKKVDEIEKERNRSARASADGPVNPPMPIRTVSSKPPVEPLRTAPLPEMPPRIPLRLPQESSEIYGQPFSTPGRPLTTETTLDATSETEEATI